MAGFSYATTTPQINARDMINDLMARFTNSGGTAWFNVIAAPTGPAKDSWLFESSQNIDSHLAVDATQKYRILFQRLKVNNTTTVTEFAMYFGDANQIKPTVDNTDVVIAPNTPKVLLLSTETMMPSINNECNYRVTFTGRGFALAIWPTVKINQSANNSMVVLQRPVNPSTGLPKVEGTAPIFAMWHGAEVTGNYFEWGIVREKDRSPSYAMEQNTVTGIGWETNRYNFYKISLDWAHPNLFDNNSHVVKFPYGFATNRHLYMEELDLVCLINASAFAGKQDVKITMYGESAERTYKTTWGDVAYGTKIGVTVVPRLVAGTRIGLLSVGGGIA